MISLQNSNLDLLQERDLVLCLNCGSSKFLKHLGPYEIKEVLGNSGYWIRSIIYDAEFMVSHYYLIPFLPITLNDDARKLAATDINEYVAENITAHSEEENGFRFLVNFLNGPTLWQPLESLREYHTINESLLKYVTAHDIQLPPRLQKNRRSRKSTQNKKKE
ncbi:hypothetical protein RCL1_003239 [Eukaryota sp. TZLM3-RCL]